MTFLFSYFGALGMLLALGLAAEYWECSSQGQKRLLACGAVVGGSVGCSFIGLASALGARVLLLAVLILAGSSWAMRSTVAAWV